MTGSTASMGKEPSAPPVPGWPIKNTRLGTEPHEHQSENRQQPRHATTTAESPGVRATPARGLMSGFR